MPVAKDYIGRLTDNLLALMPQDILREQIKESFKQDAEATKDQPVFPPEVIDELEIAKYNLLVDPNISAEVKKETKEAFQEIKKLSNQTVGEFDVANPLTTEEIEKRSYDTACYTIAAWVLILKNVLILTNPNEDMRLDENLLPAANPIDFFGALDLTFLDYIALQVNDLIVPEQAKIVYLAFKDKVKETVEQHAGLEFAVDLFIKKDENGYFITRKV